jgi:predicted RNase H-like HicB family nuclease
MKTDPYHYVVYWSDEDGCYVGQCPDLFYGGTHGDDPEAVFHKLRQMAQEVIEDLEAKGKPLPPARDLAEALSLQQS